MHNGFLQVEGEKMSKSLGNFVTINELLETEKFGGRKWPGEVLRLAMLMTHYREPIDWTAEIGRDAGDADGYNIADLLSTMWRPLPSRIPTSGPCALSDDLNTPSALSIIHGLGDEIRSASARNPE